MKNCNNCKPNRYILAFIYSAPAWANVALHFIKPILSSHGCHI